MRKEQAAEGDTGQSLSVSIKVKARQKATKRFHLAPRTLEVRKRVVVEYCAGDDGSGIHLHQDPLLGRCSQQLLGKADAMVVRRRRI